MMEKFPILAESAAHPDSCPNLGWWTLGRNQQYLQIFRNKLLEDSQLQISAPHSARDQLVDSVRSFFGESGIQSCHYDGCEDFRNDCRRAIPECKWNFFRECLVTWLSCWRFSCERMKQDYTEAMEASKMSQEERVPGSPEATEERNATGLSTSFPAQ